MDFDKPQFQNSHLTQATGLSSETLQTWANRGLLRSSTPGRVGSGQRRLYSAADVVRVRATQRLMDFGLPVSIAAEIMSSAVLDAETIALVFDKQRRGDKVLMCISRSEIGYRSVLVNASKRCTFTAESEADDARTPEAVRNSPLVRVAEAMAADAATRGAYLTIEVGELVRETVAQLENLRQEP